MTANNPTEGQSSGMNFGDICYVLFRHKGKILAFAALGVLGAVAFLFLKPPVYESEAMLFVRYVVDRGEPRSVNSSPTDPQFRTPDARGDGIIITEKQIIESFDLANQVAAVIGPGKILGTGTVDGNQAKAASMIRKGLTVEATKNSSILSVVFRHPDPGLVQPVVGLLITNYLRKHIEAHRPAGALDDLRKKTDELRADLAKNSAELSRLKAEAGISSLDDAKVYFQQMAKVKDKLDEAEVDLASRGAALGESQNISAAISNQVNAVTTNAVTANTVGTNAVVTNAVAANPVATNAVTVLAELTPEQIQEYETEYRNIGANLEALHKQETEYLRAYTPESFFVLSIRGQISKLDKRKRELEKAHPPLARVSPTASPTSGQPALPGVNPSVVGGQEKAALEAKIKMLREQLKEVEGRVDKVRQLEPRIAELQLRTEVQEKDYRYSQARVEQWSADESVGAGKFSNINVVQEPSPPAREFTKTMKTAAIVLVFGLLGGIGLAFFIDLAIDHSVRRPKDVTAGLHLPLFLTIPYLNGVSRRKRSGEAAKKAVEPGAVVAPGAIPGKAEMAVAGMDGMGEGSRLRPYYEALRDQLINHFDVNNMAHKPKLIAVAGCSKGSGATSTAAGLAATLSETGDGNVLLVDMNLQQGAAHPFYRGKPACGLLDVLETEKRTPALVQDNLYMATVNQAADRLPQVLPRRFMNLLPKLKMSDYDYIIFDMPAVSQTSITNKVASLMDMVLLVVESEKTNQNALRRASALMETSRVNAKVVLNKYRPHVPQWLQHDL